MKFFDISKDLSAKTIPWPGDTQFQRTQSQGTAIVSKLILSTHTGTHIDAPKHFLFKKSGVDQIRLQKLVGTCKVVKVESSPLIQVNDLKGLKIKAGDKILFKTKNGRLLKQKKFISNYVSLSLTAAQYLAAKKIDLIGIDYFGIEAKSAPGHPVHKTLLAAGIVIVEGLDLSKVGTGTYNLAALPLKIKGGDGSPARVILWK